MSEYINEEIMYTSTGKRSTPSDHINYIHHIYINRYVYILLCM